MRNIWRKPREWQPRNAEWEEADFERCAAAVIRGGWRGEQQCSRKGRLEHAGRKWCEQHHQPTINAEKEKQSEQFKKQQEAKEDARLEVEAITAVAKRVHEANPELEIEDYQRFVRWHNESDSEGGEGAWLAAKVWVPMSRRQIDLQRKKIEKDQEDY